MALWSENSLPLSQIKLLKAWLGSFLSNHFSGFKHRFRRSVGNFHREANSTEPFSKYRNASFIFTA
ncbi:MAG TPA: hypothetical protein VGC17_01280 [Lactovum miscens]